MATPPESYIATSDLRAAMSPSTFLALFDDANVGTVADDDSAVLQVIARAHSEVLSYLPRAYESLPVGVPSLLFSAELDYAICFSMDRHPEYEKTSGTNRRDTAWTRAEKKMERVAESIQILTDDAPATSPGTQGGIITDPNINRTIVDSPDGTSNRGDF